VKLQQAADGVNKEKDWTEGDGGRRGGDVDGRRLDAGRPGRQRDVDRRRSSPPAPYEPEVDPRRVGIGQLRHETSVDERQSASGGRVAEVTTTIGRRRRRRKTATRDLVARVVDLGGTSSSTLELRC